MIGGRRGKKKAVVELPDTETRDEKIRCTLCLQYAHDYGLDNAAGFMPVENFRRSHLKSARHQRSVSAKTAADAVLDAASQVQRDKPESFIRPASISFPTEQPPRTEQNAYVPPQHSEMDTLMRNFDGNFELDQGLDEILFDEQAAFMHEAKEYTEWSSHSTTLHSAGADLLDGAEDEDHQDSLLSELLKNIDRGKLKEDTDDPAGWAPYPSKTVFLLDVVDNLPRNRISSGFMKVLLWLLAELGVDNVPSFERLRSIQKTFRETKGVHTVQVETPKGQAYSFNDLPTLVGNDWSNPLLRPHIRRYPVIPKDGVISEIWHAQKWRKDIDRACLSPMYDAGGGQHYYVDELAECVDKSMVVPLRWLEDETGDVWCEASSVLIDGVTNCASIDDENIIMVKASHLAKDYPTLQDEGNIPRWSTDTVSKGLEQRMPNPDRELAGGHAMYTSFVDIFGDDVSGNKSKSWNKHWNIYMSHRNLPRKLLFQTYNTHFISTSTYASVPEQFHGIKSVIDETHKKPLTTRDALTGHTIKIKIYCNCGPGDNPSQSETSGHIGGNGNFPCRKCKVGGTQKEKETDSGFHAFFEPGDPRSSTGNLAAVEAQLNAACTGVAQTVKDLQTNTGIKDMYTQHWIDDLINRARELSQTSPHRTPAEIKTELLQSVTEKRSTMLNPFLCLKGFDAPIDTPVEILHTILLGVVKYVWHGSHTSWNKSQKALYTYRLRATDTLFLSIPSIRSSYIMQYANSLNGRQLKTLAQVNVFHVHDLVDDLQFKLTKAVGELSALLWITEIQNLDEYLDDVDTAAANVLDLAAQIDPSKILSKIKYHLLTHLRQDIIRFGPLVGVATETFECFNAIFRFCSVLSNHIAPSRDIAYQLASQEALKHILSGGWSLSEKTGTWEQAGPCVRQYMNSHPTIQGLLGWTVPEEPRPAGFVTLQPADRKESKTRDRKELAWLETQGPLAVNPPSRLITDTKWYRGKTVVAQSQDQCRPASWIYAVSPFSTDATKQPPIVGKIIEILQDVSKTTSLVVLDVFQVCSIRDEVFSMPVLMRPFDERRVVIIESKEILFGFNVQHHCRLARCAASGERVIRQERKDTSNTESIIQHQPLEQYLINIHAFHNAHLLRRVIPRDLIAPIPYVEDRVSHHLVQSSKLREGKKTKRAAAAAAKAAANIASTGTTPMQMTGNEEVPGGAGRKRRRTRNLEAASELEQGIDNGLDVAGMDIDMQEGSSERDSI